MAPVHFRIIKNRKTRYISSGLMLHIDEWDFSNNKVKSKHNNSSRMNAFLAKKFSEIQDSILDYETTNRSVTSDQLKQHIYGSKPVDFFEFAEKLSNEYLANKQISTHNLSKIVIQKLRNFVGNKAICLQEITPEFLEKFVVYLRTTCNNNTNTTAKNIKFIRRVFSEAYRKDLIEHSANPFRKYKFKSEKTERTYLSEGELFSIETKAITEGSKADTYRNMFVFASYAGGIRVSDVLKLRWMDFDGTHIHVTMRKTKEQISIKLPIKSLDIINKYKHLKKSNTSYIFPVLPDDFFKYDAAKAHRVLMNATSTINNALNKIRLDLNIPKRVSFHISRHTFATRALKKGIAIDKVQKILGHTDIKETQIYAKIVNSELDKAMDVFND
jgi:integrase